MFDINDEALRLQKRIKDLKIKIRTDPQSQIIKADEYSNPVFKTDRSWPSDGYMAIQLTRLEKHMRYYCVNYSESEANKNGRNGSFAASPASQDKYIKYVADHTSGKIKHYIGSLVRQMLFDGRTVRNLEIALEYDFVYNLDVEAVIFSIKKISFEKYTKQRGSIQRNIMMFSWDADGALIENEYICETLPKVFNDANLALMTQEMCVLMERFNHNVSNLIQQKYDRSPEAKAKKLYDVCDKNKEKFFSHLNKLSEGISAC